jgi:hypothetical protein
MSFLHQLPEWFRTNLIRNHPAAFGFFSPVGSEEPVVYSRSVSGFLQVHAKIYHIHDNLGMPHRNRRPRQNS